MSFNRTAVYEHDRTWMWKAILRAFAIISNIVGIGLTGWALQDALAASQRNGSYNHYYYWTNFDAGLISWNLITFSLSFIWCLTNLCILFTRNRWIHPGANVGCDLVLWLSFIVTAVFSTAATVQDLYYYSAPYSYDDYSYTNYDGTTYASYPNGTTYEVTPSHPAPQCPGFDSCEAKTSFLDEQHKQGAVVAAATAFAWLLVLVHFALFISACRYTHRLRCGRVAKSAAAQIEANIIRKLEAEGRLRTPPEMAHGGGQQMSESASAPEVVPNIRVDAETADPGHGKERVDGNGHA